MNLYKNNYKCSYWVLLATFLLLSYSCSDWNLAVENFPEVTTTATVKAGNNPTEIIISGTITGLLPGASVSEHGHFWGVDSQPNLNEASEKTLLNQRTNGDFESIVTDLTPGQTIFFQAYAIFEQEILYGEVFSYTPEDFVFQLSTDSVISITRSEILSEVIIQNSIIDLPAQLTIKELGIVWANHPEPTLDADNFLLNGLNVLNQASTFDYQSKLTNLPPDRYYIRSYLKIGERTYYGNTLCFSIGDFWIKLGNFPDSPRPSGINFSVNGMGYFGGGGSPVFSALSRGYFSDFWQYDPTADNWSQLADVPHLRGSPIFLSADNKGYFAFGNGSAFGPEYFNDLVEYDPSTNQWNKKATFPGGPRNDVIAFSINDLIYIGTGSNYSPTPYDDFWQYDPKNDNWTEKNKFPGGSRSGGESFVIGQKGYLLDDSVFWEYLPSSDQWKQKNYPSVLESSPKFLFNINGKAYFSESLRFWEYDPLQESWTLRTNLPLFVPSAFFAVNGLGYIGVDDSQGNTAFWTYYPLQECE